MFPFGAVARAAHVRTHAGMIIVLRYLVRAIPFCLLGTTIILPAIHVK